MNLTNSTAKYMSKYKLISGYFTVRNNGNLGTYCQVSY